MSIEDHLLNADNDTKSQENLLPDNLTNQDEVKGPYRTVEEKKTDTLNKNQQKKTEKISSLMKVFNFAANLARPEHNNAIDELPNDER